MAAASTTAASYEDNLSWMRRAQRLGQIWFDKDDDGDDGDDDDVN